MEASTLNSILERLARLDAIVKDHEDRILTNETRFKVMSDAFPITEEGRAVMVKKRTPVEEASSTPDFTLTTTPDGCRAAILPDEWTPTEILPHRIMVFVGRANRPLVQIKVRGPRLSKEVYDDLQSRAIYYCKANDIYTKATKFLREAA